MKLSSLGHSPASLFPPAASSSQALRVLIVSHMHPAVSRGGAEIAAYQMYRALKAVPGITAFFLAAEGGKVAAPLGVSIFQPFEEDEYVCSGGDYSHFNHSNPSATFPGAFRRLLRELRPDVVHFHHFANLGLEAFLHVRQELPHARIVLTVHEYLAICNHFGQMVKRPGLALCNRATPRDCARCFPEHGENDFFMRELFIRRFLSLVDQFIAPSRFLAERYVAWGVPAERMAVVENGMPAMPAPRPPPSDEGGLVLGFFGQISLLKGVNLLLGAAALLSVRRAVRNRIRIEIHGDASNQPPALREGLDTLLRHAGDIVVMRGAYDNERVHDLMGDCHAVLVPSIWWENSPLVIQEAFASRRPVICSGIGGMAEKVRDGLDGFHFRAGSAAGLADLIEELVKSPARLSALQATLTVPPALDETVWAVLALYWKAGPELEAEAADGVAAAGLVADGLVADGLVADGLVAAR